MTKNRFEIWLVNLGTKTGTEAGKIRPCLVVQSDLLHSLPSTLICPISSSPWNTGFLRIPVARGETGLVRESVILVEQIRALDNTKFLRKLGILSASTQKMVDQSLKIVLELT